MGCRLSDDKLRQDMILFRIYGENTSDGVIDRNKEILVMRVLEEAGCGQPVYCGYANGMAYKFTPGEVLNPDSVRKPHVSR